MLLDALLAIGRFVDRLLGLAPKAPGWPPLSNAPTAARIDGERAEDAWAQRQGLAAVPYNPDPAVCAAACEEWIGPATPEQGPTLTQAEATALADADTPE
jgi:hypothetical protein